MVSFFHAAAHRTAADQHQDIPRFDRYFRLPFDRTNGGPLAGKDPRGTGFAIDAVGIDHPEFVVPVADEQVLPERRARRQAQVEARRRGTSVYYPDTVLPMFPERLSNDLCSLRPGVPGVSDHITVRSIVGRFLEHSRIFWFANDGAPVTYIGSADVMERNLDRRVEVLSPVTDPAMTTHIRDVILAAYLRDTARCRLLTREGTYVSPADDDETPGVNAQDLLLEWHAAEARFES